MASNQLNRAIKKEIDGFNSLFRNSEGVSSGQVQKARCTNITIVACWLVMTMKMQLHLFLHNACSTVTVAM